jgi:lactate dehydrogenase-like 2-hydroxyacid dehydrogenase
MLTDRMDRPAIESAGSTSQLVNLRHLATMSVGFDHIDMDACRDHRISVYNTPDVLTDATAELAVGLLLATLRRIPEAQQAALSGQVNYLSSGACGIQSG